MTEDHKIRIFDSWKIKRGGIFAEIIHSENGLFPGTILACRQSGLKWEIKYRVLFFQAYGEHRKFQNEQAVVSRKSGIQTTEYEDLVSAIINKESKNIFQYNLHPVGHDQKPEKGEVLEMQQNYS